MPSSKPVPYEQIRREVMAKRKLKPWEVIVARGHEEDETDDESPAESPEKTTRAQSAAVDPMTLAMKRQKLQEGLAPMGDVANPETMAAREKKRPNTGLMNLLMSLMAR